MGRTILRVARDRRGQFLDRCASLERRGRALGLPVRCTSNRHLSLHAGLRRRKNTVCERQASRGVK